MTQKEILKYYKDNGGLRCKDWSWKEIYNYIKQDLGEHQRVWKITCLRLKREAEVNQR